MTDTSRSSNELPLAVPVTEKMAWYPGVGGLIQSIRAVPEMFVPDPVSSIVYCWDSWTPGWVIVPIQFPSKDVDEELGPVDEDAHPAADNITSSDARTRIRDSHRVFMMDVNLSEACADGELGKANNG